LRPQVHIFGIPNCDQVKKTRAWFATAGFQVEFHDFRRQAPNTALLTEWLACFGADTLVNRKGTTWRALSENQREQATDVEQLLALLKNFPNLIKRPVVHYLDQRSLAYSPDIWARWTLS
jgi:arsenate reductase (glutaredoxin)